MRSIRKLPELCLFLYFGTMHIILRCLPRLMAPDQFDGMLDSPWLGMYGTYLIAKDQLYLDKACRWVLGAPCKYLSTNWISQRRAGWTCQPGSSTTAGTPPSAPTPLTHRGTKCWKISGIRWAVCFPAKATQGVPIKVPDRFQELAWPVSARSNNHFYHRTGLHKLWQLAAT